MQITKVGGGGVCVSEVMRGWGRCRIQLVLSVRRDRTVTMSYMLSE